MVAIPGRQLSFWQKAWIVSYKEISGFSWNSTSSFAV